METRYLYWDGSGREWPTRFTTGSMSEIQKQTCWNIEYFPINILLFGAVYTCANILPSHHPQQTTQVYRHILRIWFVFEWWEMTCVEPIDDCSLCVIVRHSSCYQTYFWCHNTYLCLAISGHIAYYGTGHFRCPMVSKSFSILAYFVKTTYKYWWRICRSELS